MSLRRCAALLMVVLAASTAAVAKKDPPPSPSLTGSAHGTALVVNGSFVAHSQAPVGQAPTLDADDTAVASSESPVGTLQGLWSSADRGRYFDAEFAKAEAGVQYASLLGTIEVDAIHSGAGISCAFGGMSKYTAFAYLRVAGNIFYQPVPPNTFVMAGPLVVIINEQRWDGTTFAVTGIHIQGPDLDIRIAEAVATLADCPEPTTPPKP